jgi:hypothetical protein
MKPVQASRSIPSNNALSMADADDDADNKPVLELLRKDPSKSRPQSQSVAPAITVQASPKDAGALYSKDSSYQGSNGTLNRADSDEPMAHLADDFDIDAEWDAVDGMWSFLVGSRLFSSACACTMLTALFLFCIRLLFRAS